MRFVVESLGLRLTGGKELGLNLLARFANHREHEFVLLLPDLPEYAALRGTNLNLRLFPKRQGLLKRYWFLNWAVPKICSEQRADALLCLGNFPPRNPPCPTVVLFHKPSLVYPEPMLREHVTLREKLILGYGRYVCWRLLPRFPVIVQTEVVRERLTRLYGLDPQKVFVVPNSCPFSLDGNGNFAGKRSDPSQPFTFLCISWYFPYKNIEILAEALKHLPAYTRKPARCVINISADQHPRARKLLRRIAGDAFSERMISLGWIPSREALAEVYRSADAYIFPSLMETFSFTYLEAMRFGLPILTSDRDFARDRCQDAALYFDPLDPKSVARSMARLIEDQELRARLVENGQRIVRQIPTWDEIAARFVEVLERAAAGSGLPAPQA
jgi:glycosyltransferase involved in cell wall biosynthesis